MKGKLKALVCLLFSIGTGAVLAGTTNNQTDDLSTVLPGSNLPFQVVIEQANFQLPVGFHSGVFGVFKAYWVFIAGRINGMHGFGVTNNFPPDQQNTAIYVVNWTTGQVYSRALSDPGSGLSRQQIEYLSVTSPEGYQEGNTLYMVGGYGTDSAAGTLTTKPVLTAFNLPGVVTWVVQPGNRANTLAKNIKQIAHPIFQITGGRMYRIGDVTHLVFGQNFTGEYTPGSNGNYSMQVRRFRLKNVGGQLGVDVYNSVPASPNPNYRRRDLNVVPVLFNSNNTLQQALVAYAGVFTLDSGVWTVPVLIQGSGDPIMASPELPSTFKQAMNQYVTATASLYSRRFNSTYNLFFGGISYGFYSGGTFNTDAEIPFINQVTTVQMDQNGSFRQYLMNAEYPVILSTGTNPGNQLLFGAGATFVPENIPVFPNGMINLDNIRRPTVIGHIVGGIQSTLANTNTMADSSASPYVFRVILVPTQLKTAHANANKYNVHDRIKRREKKLV